MIDDPRIKRILKRYPKDNVRFDASIDLSDLPIEEVRAAFRCSADDTDTRPRKLDDYAIDCFSKRWPDAFDAASFDYFVHLYLKSEFAWPNPRSADMPSVPSENGPPPGASLPEGMRWVSVKPSDEGFENYMGMTEDEI